MGIERFFTSIEENNITNLKNKFTEEYQSKLDADYFFIDFNSIVHITSFKVSVDLNYIIYQILIKSNKQDDVKFIIDKYNLEFDNNINIKELYEYLDGVIDDIVIDQVINEVVDIVDKYIKTEQLKTLFIAIDGVPNKAKMAEQRKRRYMGSILSIVKDLIYDKHKDKMDKNRKLFEQYKISFNKNKIGPGTEFMHKLYIRLLDNDFNLRIRNLCPKLTKIICSGQYEGGEGEKKIVDYLMNNKFDKSNHVIYSPDSDVTLLALLLNNNEIKNLTILRHNQQKHTYDIINVDKLAENLFAYVKSKCKNEVEKYRIIDDIVFALTIFGNDFLPKIESFDVKNDFGRLIDRYIETINNGNYIIESDKKNKRKKINHKMLLLFIKHVHIEEGSRLQKNYLSVNYSNYNKLKELLDANHDNFTLVMSTFLDKLHEFNNDMKKMEYNNIINKWGNDTKFIPYLIKVSIFKDTDQLNFLNMYYNYFKKEHKIPKARVILHKYSRSTEDEYHQKQMSNMMSYIDDKITITEYDKEVYKFENMLDEYQKKLNSSNLELGTISVDYKTYKWNAEKIEKGVLRYYNDFFGIKTLDIKNKKLNKLLYDYVLGLIWVFDYYYNFSPDKYTSGWQYSYDRAPLLTQIYYYLRDNSNNNIIDEMQEYVDKSYIEKDKYFNPLEHLLYVSPKNVLLEIAPKEFHKLIKKENIFLDTTKIGRSIIKKHNNNVIDCRGVKFLTKCHINDSIVPFIVDNKFIKLLRSITLLPETIKLTGDTTLPKTNIINYGNVISLRKLYQ